ncbi:MAG: hypothetical protein NC407_07135, partial [Lachnoclostridium sp.]|nr:hypothetical protein [Lachnoclostridium sp.]
TDTQTTVEFINAMQVAAADEDANLTTSETYTVTSAAHSDTIAVSTDLQTVLGTNIGVMDAATMTGSTYQSTAYTDAVLNLTLSYNTTRLVWEVTASTTSGEVGINGSINP